MNKHIQTDSNQSRPDLDVKLGIFRGLIFLGVLLGVVVFSAFSISADMQHSGIEIIGGASIALLGFALLIALGFEFVNGFHDTANAVATVIYTNSLKASTAVVWSGFCNLLGVLLSSGTVAFTILSLLPVELILQVGTSTGFAMVFALLVAAILWNLGTWLVGLPASSSHTLIGSIIGVGLANAWMNGKSATSGIDWSHTTKVGYSLLVSPLLGFTCAALLLLIVKYLFRKPEIFQQPSGKTPPPLPIRLLLILTCSGVSFFHGSNDGQKGMGLIMLILVGILPVTYALNKSLPENQMSNYYVAADAVQLELGKLPNTLEGQQAYDVVVNYINTREFNPHVFSAVNIMISNLSSDLKHFGSTSQIPSEKISQIRNHIYLISESIKFMEKKESAVIDPVLLKHLKQYKKEIDSFTKFIPFWVRISVAFALGLGTMVGWKRIVVTVGEKIGKEHMSYAQGASAELITMTTIGAADIFALPVSTTQVLSSSVAGAMATNQSGLQWNTVRNLAIAWILTLPISMILSGSLYWLFSILFKL